MYIYIVTLQMKAPVQAEEKKASLFSGADKPKTSAALPDNMILVNGYEFPSNCEFILVDSGVAIYPYDFYKIRRGDSGGRLYSETVVIEGIEKLEETIRMLMERAREAIKDSPLLDMSKPFIRLTNDNTAPGLSEYGLTPAAYRQASQTENKPEKGVTRGDSGTESLLGKFRSLFSK